MTVRKAVVLAAARGPPVEEVLPLKGAWAAETDLTADLTAGLTAVAGRRRRPAGLHHQQVAELLAMPPPHHVAV